MPFWTHWLERLGVFYYLLYERDLPLATAEPELPAGYCFRELGPRDLPRFASLVSPDRLRRLAGRFREGKRCYGIVWGNDVVCYTWTSEEADPRMRRVRPPLGADERYGFDTYCSPSHRRRGLATACLQGRLYHLHAVGVRRVCGFTEWGNRAMRGVYQKAGYRKVNVWFYVSSRNSVAHHPRSPRPSGA